MVICSACNNNKEVIINTKNEAVDASKSKSIVVKIKELDHRPISERIALYHELKKNHFDSYDFSNEDELNMYGYGHLWSGKIKDAIAIFSLLVEEFPNSSNTYDSLGEAYLADGNEKLSLINYEKSLALNPDNFGAEDQIERIRYPDKVQETPQEKFSKVYTVQEYLTDLDQLGQKLMDIHPNVFKFTPKEEFLDLISAKKKLINMHTTYGEFRWHCNEIIASVNCSHTSMGDFYPEDQMVPASKRFPLQVRWTDNSLYIIDLLNTKSGLKIKDKITSINGTEVDELIEKIYKRIPSQGFIETTKNHVFNTWATLLIPFALNFPESYSIQLEGQEESISLNKAQQTLDPISDTSIKRCGEPLCLDILDNSETAILGVYSFNFYPWNNLDVFKDWINEAFEKIRKKKIKNLIVDVRFNGGGSPESSIYLLRHLVDKTFTYYGVTDYDDKEGKGPQEPFKNHFKGRKYFLIDGNGNSTTGHFMSIVKVLKLGTIIGEELGSNQFCSAGQTVARLKNTKLEFYVANNTNETMATALPDEIGILPDHYVNQSIDEYVNQIDAVKKFAIKLIER